MERSYLEDALTKWNYWVFQFRVRLWSVRNHYKSAVVAQNLNNYLKKRSETNRYLVSIKQVPTKVGMMFLALGSM
jgi:hypothetical protein